MPVLAKKKLRRTFKFEVRSIAEEKKDANGVNVATVTGYASVFGKVDWYDDIIKAGAFTKTLQERSKVKVLWQHDPCAPIGVPTSMVEDGYGLLVTFDLNLDVAQGREAYALLKQKAIDGLSIGFDPVKDEMDRDTGIRTITEVRLWEFSVVTFQAQEAAMVVDVRSMNDGGALMLHKFERSSQAVKEFKESFVNAMRSKDFATCLKDLDGSIDELLALRDSIEVSAAASEDTPEPAKEDYSAEELEEMKELITLLREGREPEAAA